MIPMLLSVNLKTGLQTARNVSNDRRISPRPLPSTSWFKQRSVPEFYKNFRFTSLKKLPLHHNKPHKKLSSNDVNVNKTVAVRKTGRNTYSAFVWWSDFLHILQRTHKHSTLGTSQWLVCGDWGSHSGSADESSVLGSSYQRFERW